MPYSERRNYIYRNAVVKTIKEIEAETNVIFEEPYRLDEKSITGRIPDQLIEDLSNSDVVIADISDPNLNVVYELGFVHALKKIVIPIRESSSKTTLPFDLKVERYFEYSLPIDKSELEIATQKFKLEIKKILIKEMELGKL